MDAVLNPQPGLLDFLRFTPLSFPLLPLTGLVMAGAYVTGAIRLWVQGRRWSVPRTVSFLLGCAMLVMVTGLAVEAYGYALFSVFMFQQLTLMMAIPPLLVIGSPGTLLARAVPRRGAGRWIRHLAAGALRSRAARYALSPAVAVPLYLLAFYGLYFGGLADTVLAVPGGHVALEVGFLAAGLLFAIPILSDDPLPLRMSFPGRAVDVFAEAALHAFFGVILMMGTTLVVMRFTGPTEALGIDPLADQQIAGGLAWSYGEAPTLLMLLYVVYRWFRDDTARAAAADRHADQHGDAELDAYNDYLRSLRDNTRGSR